MKDKLMEKFTQKLRTKFFGKGYTSWEAVATFILSSKECLELLRPLYGVSEKKAWNVLNNNHDIEENFKRRHSDERLKRMSEALSTQFDLVEVRR